MPFAVTVVPAFGLSWRRAHPRGQSICDRPFASQPTRPRALSLMDKCLRCRSIEEVYEKCLINCRCTNHTIHDNQTMIHELNPTLTSGDFRFHERADDLRLEWSARSHHGCASGQNAVSHSGGSGDGVRAFSARHCLWSRRVVHRNKTWRSRRQTARCFLVEDKAITCLNSLRPSCQTSPSLCGYTLVGISVA